MCQTKIPRETNLAIAREKHHQLQTILQELDIDCWLIFVRETAAIPDPIMELVVVGDVVWQSAFIFSLQKNDLRTAAIVGNYDVLNEKEKELWDEVIGYTEGISGPLKAYMNKIAPQKIALNYSKNDVTADGLTFGMYKILAEILAEHKTKFRSAEQIIQKLRGQKSKTEIALVRKACELTEKIFEEIIPTIKEGMNELEIQKLFHEKMDALGVSEAWQRNSCPAVDAGPDKEIGHAGPDKRIKVRKGHTIHFDFGVKLHGYCSDIQRMIFLGTKQELPEELKHAFETVHGAITAAAEFIRPGVKGFEVDKVARDYVVARGYEEFGHALGHQVGTRAHDGGVLLGPLWERYGETSKGVVEENMIFTLELNVKTKNFGYVSLEEDILVTKEGCEFLIPRQNDFWFIT